jgi:hypothetical protein
MAAPPDRPDPDPRRTDPTPAPQPKGRPGRALTRPAFEQVIRRAAELSLSDADADEQLSETEVLRIATELGLPAHHVQRALFELPELTVQPRWYDRYYGPAVFSITRVIPSETATILRRIEDYLITREYLQIVRRRGDTMAFVPADDTISSLARALFRPGSRHIVSRASRVLVGAHALPDQRGAHVRFDVDLSESRRETLRAGTAVGMLGGIFTGSLAAALTAGALPADFGFVPHVLAFGGTMAATAAAGFSVAANRFRSRVDAARLELIGLLDRLEHGDRLDPPPAPWRRKLQLRLFGDRDR